MVGYGIVGQLEPMGIWRNCRSRYGESWNVAHSIRRGGGADSTGSNEDCRNLGMDPSCDTEGPDVELDESLRNLLDKIEPCTEALCELEGEGYSVVWRCVVATNDLEHDIELDRATLRRLVALPGVLRLDV